MHLDVLDLRSFYYRTKLGRIAQRAIRDRVQKFWPDAKGQTVAGFGFAAPLLRPYLADARRVIALMPGPQGVMAWPAAMPNVSVLVEEAQWPLQTGVLDKLVMLHGLETSEQPGALLEEARRVLGPGGRALFIVPSRTGLWARRDGTPFGFGRPYTMGQLESQLRKYNFTVESSTSALFAPPSTHGFWLRTSEFWERNGRRFAPWLAGGVLMVEVSKQSHAPVNGGLGAVVRKPLRILEGMANPVPAARDGQSVRTTVDADDQQGAV
jgi:SAM-dependent methyltransferase